MKPLIILLRGVMPTGKNKVPMAELRSALEEAGLCNVKTYIQSGNVVASTSLKPPEVERLVHDVIQEKFGGDLAVMARTAPYFKNAIAQNPFKNADPSKLYFTIFSAKPDSALLKQFLAPGYLPDQIEVIDDMAYVLCATKYSDLKIHNNYIERKLKMPATTRIYNTIAALIDLSQE